MIGDDGRDVEPGSGQTGRVAVKGHTPIGYYKDPEKSAATFVVIDGETYSIPGDYAQVEADGTLTLLGRGSVVHQHRRREGLPRGGRGDPQGAPDRGTTPWPSASPTTSSARPSPRWSQAQPGAELDDAELIAWVKSRLASFKAPKHVVPIDTIGRAPNGKVDYKRLKGYAADQLGVPLES